MQIQDCLPQEEYRSTYPNGESESPYVFICSNPQELPVKFPISGAHKICKWLNDGIRSSYVAHCSHYSSLLSYLSSKNTFSFADKLDDSIHIAAVKALQRMAKLKDEEN